MKAKHIFNLYYSLKLYDKKGEQNMGMTPEQMKSILREKINGKETVGFSDDAEYYFAVGQMVNYFISISRMSKKIILWQIHLFRQKIILLSSKN